MAAVVLHHVLYDAQGRTVLIFWHIMSGRTVWRGLILIIVILIIISVPLQKPGGHDKNVLLLERLALP